MAWVNAINACDVSAMDALCVDPPFTLVVQGKKFELGSMGSLLDFDKMKSSGWRETSIKGVAVLHGDETQVHVTATLGRHMADGAKEATCSAFFLTKINDDYKMVVGGNTTPGGSTVGFSK